MLLFLRMWVLQKVSFIIVTTPCWISNRTNRLSL
jgi:hypothetical protein